MTAGALLRQVWGFDAFRPGQEEIVAAVAAGRDVLAIMPTGGGKSLCFQLPALLRETADLVVTSDPEPLDGIAYQPLFDYAPLLAVPAGHPLATRGWAEPADLAAETVITYPMDRARLDVFSHFLTPAKVEPAAVRTVEQTAVALMLVAAGRGVAVLPDWVLRREVGNPELALLRLGRDGLLRRVLAAVREEDLGLPFMAHFLRLARTEPLRLMR